MLLPHLQKRGQAKPRVRVLIPAFTFVSGFIVFIAPQETRTEITQTQRLSVEFLKNNGQLKPATEFAQKVTQASQPEIGFTCDFSQFEYPTCSGPGTKNSPLSTTESNRSAQRNDFFQELLRNRPTVSTTCSDSKTESLLTADLDPKCTFAALHLNQKIAPQYLAACGGQPAQPACLSRELHTAIHNSLSLTAKCLSIPGPLILTKLTSESRLQINARSGRGSSGLGQITGDWLTDARNKWSYFKKSLVETDFTCQKISASIEEALKSRNECQLLSPPTSPLLSAFLGGLHFANSRARIASQFTPTLQSQFLVDSASRSSQLLNKLKDEKEKQDGFKRIRATKNKQATNTDNEGVARLRKEIRELDQKIKSTELEINELQLGVEIQTRRLVLADETNKKVINELSLYAYNFGLSKLLSLWAEFEKSPFGKASPMSSITGKNGRFLRFLKSLPETHKAFNPPVATDDPEARSRRKEEMLNYVYLTQPYRSGGPDSRKLRASGSASSMELEMNRINSHVQTLFPEVKQTCADFQ